MTGDEVMTLVRDTIGEPNYDSFFEIDRALRKICKITHFNFLRVRDEDRLVFKFDKQDYPLDMSDMRRLTGIYIHGVTGSADAYWHILEETNEQVFEEKYSDARTATGTTNRDTPVYYTLEGGPQATIRVVPTPDQDYRGMVKFIRNTPRIIRDEHLPIPQDYGDTLALLAGGYILQKIGALEQNDFKVGLGRKYEGEALSEFKDIVKDVQPNRINKVEPEKLEWIS